MYLMYCSALLRKFVRNEEAASGIEYAIVVAMVAVCLVAFMTPIGGRVTEIFQNLQDKFVPAKSS